MVKKITNSTEEPRFDTGDRRAGDKAKVGKKEEEEEEVTTNGHSAHFH